MRTLLPGVATTAAALSLAAFLAAPAQAAADPGERKVRLKSGAPVAGELVLVLGSLEAFDLEEKGQDEVRVELKDGQDKYYMWPTNGEEAETRLGYCWTWTSAAAKCSGSTQRSAGPYTRLTVTPGASFTIEVWEDDHIGDDLLLSIPVIASGEPQAVEGRSTPGKGFNYGLTARIEVAS
ncbi:hypothetical protein ACIBCT_02505 [Streptosporangium sp. NPDC050855]|uniref:hypothetical protein n=1 Tax=Streptosporangium sp. NPDC050855 TaxID=3366194 RepID=UPI00379781D7